MKWRTTDEAFEALGYKTPEALRRAAYRGTFSVGVHKVGRLYKFDLEAIQQHTEYDAERPGRQGPRLLAVNG